MNPDEPIQMRFVAGGVYLPDQQLVVPAQNASSGGGERGQQQGSNSFRADHAAQPAGPWLSRLSDDAFGTGDQHDAGSAAGMALSADNIGYALLQKAGWQAGEGLGRRQQGAPSFVAPAGAQTHTKGLGNHASAPKKRKVFAR